MKRRVRKRRVLKWVGLIGCVLTLGLCALSQYVAFGYSTSTLSVGIQLSTLTVYDSPQPSIDELGWRGGRIALPQTFPRWSTQFGWPRKQSFPNGSVYREIPVWLFLLPMALATSVTWWMDRRPKTGCIHCGYNLTGNVSGICPECGMEM